MPKTDYATALPPVATIPPGPWRLYDPNRTFAESIHPRRPTFRPIYVRDANDQEVCYLGSGAEFLPLARLIIAGRDAMARLPEVIEAIGAEVEQRQTGGNDEDWAALDQLNEDLVAIHHAGTAAGGA